MQKEKTQNERLLEVEKLFGQIQELFPTNRVGLTVHGIDVMHVDESIWEIEANYNKDSKSVYTTAKRINPPDDSFDITLFNKHD